MQTVTITFPSGRTADEVCPTELAVIAWMANLGTLRYHPWPVKRLDTERVDQLRIDLDPQPGTDFVDAARAAQELGGARRCRTRGLSEDQWRPWCPRVRSHRANVRVRRGSACGDRPGSRAHSADAGPCHRQLVEGGTGRRIFVDFNQMARDRTIASAYSIRPTPNAQVSAPLSWEELNDVSPRTSQS